MRGQVDADTSSPARKLIRRFLVEIGTLAASPYLGVSTGYACEAAACNRTNLNSTNLNKETTKQFSRQAASNCFAKPSLPPVGLSFPGALVNK